MANRAYLYSANKELTQLRDLSEWRSEIPLFYKIILGCNTQLADSKIWDYEHPIGIKGDFDKGLRKFYYFLTYLQTQTNLNTEALAGFKQETMAFFEKYKEKEQELFFLEGGEVFDLIADIEPIEKQNESLYKEIVSISVDIDEILDKKPSNLFDFKNASWLTELQKDSSVLSVYWTHVTYFSFNKS
ncbi:DUF7822 domain-containing protein [Xanthocytophaga flava]|uniref:DUF7822 domain-containing protein n=1 Tax=Xanthocytophaga flava TaxID=3048013 RepID=UPI0028D508F4|nr:hypothetical protein [Xanthocytophaga flavus]